MKSVSCSVSNWVLFLSHVTNTLEISTAWANLLLYAQDSPARFSLQRARKLFHIQDWKCKRGARRSCQFNNDGRCWNNAAVCTWRLNVRPGESHSLTHSQSVSPHSSAVNYSIVSVSLPTSEFRPRWLSSLNISLRFILITVNTMTVWLI